MRALVAVACSLMLIWSSAGSASAAAPASPLDVGLVGDWGYEPYQRARLPALIADMNAAGLAFSVHDGDIKDGPPPCTDAVYHQTRRLFDSFAAPLVYTPGDNEWTDCWRSGGDPLERLAFLRRVFFPDNLSRGRRKMQVERQSSRYPENARWYAGPVTLGTLHVVGSNNGLPDGERPGNRAEYRARNAANKAWLTETFARARQRASRGVMLFMQADPRFELPPGQRYGYDDFLAALEREVTGFGRPVLLVHGDTHQFRLDKPLFTASAPRRRVENLTRIETFGPQDSAWVRVRVDPFRPEVFSVRTHFVR